MKKRVAGLPKVPPHAQSQNSQTLQPPKSSSDDQYNQNPKHQYAQKARRGPSPQGRGLKGPESQLGEERV